MADFILLRGAHWSLRMPDPHEAMDRLKADETFQAITRKAQQDGLVVELGVEESVLDVLLGVDMFPDRQIHPQATYSSSYQPRMSLCYEALKSRLTQLLADLFNKVILRANEGVILRSLEPAL